MHLVFAFLFSRSSRPFSRSLLLQGGGGGREISCRLLVPPTKGRFELAGAPRARLVIGSSIVAARAGNLRDDLHGGAGAQNQVIAFPHRWQHFTAKTLE